MILTEEQEGKLEKGIDLLNIYMEKLNEVSDKTIKTLVKKNKYDEDTLFDCEADDFSILNGFGSPEYPQLIDMINELVEIDKDLLPLMLSYVDHYILWGNEHPRNLITDGFEYMIFNMKESYRDCGEEAFVQEIGDYLD